MSSFIRFFQYISIISNCVFGFFFFCLIIYLLQTLGKLLIRKISLSDIKYTLQDEKNYFLNCAPRTRKIIVALTLFLTINAFCSLFLSKPEIGALYEKKEYSQYYEGYLYEDVNAENNAIFCIIKIQHPNIGRYWVKEVKLNGFTMQFDNGDEVYIPNGVNRMWLRDDIDIHYYYRLKNIADEDSYQRLANETPIFSTSTQASSNAYNNYDMWQVNTAKTSLNCRETPEGKIIGKVKKGALLYMDHYENGWGYAYDENLESLGWVNLSYCTTCISMSGWVYITPGGKYYHTRDCQYIKEDPQAIADDADQAYEKGYRPCPTCGGW